MLKRMCLIRLVLLCLYSGLSFSNSGQYFNVSLQDGALNMTTSVPGRTYASAGIRFMTPGYAIVDNPLPSGNGYFLFSVSDTQPASFTLTGPEGNLRLRLCLNGVGSTYSCEEQTIAIPELAPILTSYHNTTGGGTGTHLIPGLGSAGLNSVHFYGLPLLNPGVCDETTTNSNFPGIPVTLHRSSLSGPAGFPDPCVAMCNDAIVSVTYPGPSASCTNVILVTA